MCGSQPVGSRSNATLSVPPGLGAASAVRATTPRRHRAVRRAPRVRGRMTWTSVSWKAVAGTPRPQDRPSVGEPIGTRLPASRALRTRRRASGDRQQRCRYRENDVERADVLGVALPEARGGLAHDPELLVGLV